MAPIVTIRGAPLDLARAFPLVEEDWRKLDLMGVTLAAIESGKSGPRIAFVLFVVRKVDPAITQADLDDLTPQEFLPIVKGVLEAAAASLHYSGRH